MNDFCEHVLSKQLHTWIDHVEYVAYFLTIVAYEVIEILLTSFLM